MTMKYTMIIAALMLSGCSSKVNFKEVSSQCKELDGKYFFVVAPSLFGSSVGAGCVEK